MIVVLGDQSASGAAARQPLRVEAAGAGSTDRAG